MMKPDQHTTTRRNLLKQTALAAAGVALAKPLRAAAAAKPGKVRLGLIGCGKRGQWLCELFAKHGGFEIAAGADYFPDKLDSFSETFSIPADKLYSGLSGCRKLIEDGNVDAVAIESPPCFHPEQARAAVEAGKHVYVAKPVAVDVPGCLSIGESGATATKKGLAFMVDFQTRADPHYREAIRRYHDGAIGTVSWGESSYHADMPFGDVRDAFLDDPENPENRLRAWGVDRVLSGDIITEQNIHTLDVMSWLMDTEPVSAFGTGSRKIRDFGNCMDHFSVIFSYPDEVDISFTSRQFSGHGTQPDGIRNRMFGSDGVLELKYSGQILLRAEDIYRGESGGIYKTGPNANIAAFHEAIASGEVANPTVAPSVRSNLVTILGRTAAYRKKEVTWKDLLAEAEECKMELELKS